MESGLSRFSSWLLRPYLDLGPLDLGPLHCRAIEEGWQAFAHEALPAFVPQRALPRGFRLQLADETGDPAYQLTDPRDLPKRLRTERWNELCSALVDWSALTAERKCRLICLLHSLCLYETVVSLIQPQAAPRDAASAQFLFWRASAKYMLELPERTTHYRHADMTVLEGLIDAPVSDSRTRFNAIAMLFAHRAKTGAEVEELERWEARYGQALDAALPDLDEFTAQLFTSRFYRGTAFLPQRTGDEAEVARLMDLAEHHARSMKPETSAQDHLFHENLHAVMESRTKEALWVGDLDRALECAHAVVRADPYDAKAWVELGQFHYRREAWRQAAPAYAAAALLGPPASAVGRHMAGVCIHKAGENAIAALLFKDALEFDPLGVSPRLALAELEDFPLKDALRAWSASTLRL